MPRNHKARTVLNRTSPEHIMAESALATFVVLFHCFTELMRLILDAACFTMLLLACLMPWRWPYLGKAFREMDKREKFEGKSAQQFFLGIGDAITFCVLLVPLCSGLQTVQTCKRLRAADKSDWGDGSGMKGHSPRSATYASTFS